MCLLLMFRSTDVVMLSDLLYRLQGVSFYEQTRTISPAVILHHSKYREKNCIHLHDTVLRPVRIWINASDLIRNIKTEHFNIVTY